MIENSEPIFAQTEVPIGKNGAGSPALSSNNGVATSMVLDSGVNNAASEGHLNPGASEKLCEQGQQSSDKLDGNVSGSGSLGGKDCPVSHSFLPPYHSC